MKYYSKKALDQNPEEIVPANIENKTIKLIHNGKRCTEVEKMKDRRQKLMNNLRMFGGLKGLIEGED